MGPSVTSVTHDFQVTLASHASHVWRGVTSPGGCGGETSRTLEVTSSPRARRGDRDPEREASDDQAKRGPFGSVTDHHAHG
jgi:hypothetical protein